MLFFFPVYFRRSVSLHGTGLVLVGVEQVWFEIGPRHFEARAPFAIEGALQVITVCHSEHALRESQYIKLQSRNILLLILQYFFGIS